MEDGYVWLTESSKVFLERDYLKKGQTVDERVTEICKNAERLLKKPGFADRFKENIKKGWYSLSTPVWTNFGNARGLPISCFGSYSGDNMESIVTSLAEVAIMTKHGGGTSGYFGELRNRGSEITDNGFSFGAVHFMQPFDNISNVVSQGNARRGSFAAYLPIDHKDIKEFLTLRTEGSPIQDMQYGVTVPDYWMAEMIAGDKEKQQIWATVLAARANTGFPYILFTDNANKGAPAVYRNNDRKIHASNLCTEIMLPSNEDESFVCCLSSMNILHYDAWKDTDAVELLVQFLDAVLTEFINKASKIKYLERAVRFSENHRAIGIGWLGWHSYLQSKFIPWESDEATVVNMEVAATIKRKAYAESERMAEEYGAPLGFPDLNRRNTTLLAIAPTKSSAFIIGQVSEGIEPHRANYYIKDLAKGKFTVKNEYLVSLLEAKERNTDDVWESILKNAGSVQHLDFLSDDEKAVFKTFREISPQYIVSQAADRQMYVDQGQSLNLIISPTTPVKEVNKLYIDAWKLGIKSFYYQISVNAAQEFSRNLDCVACEA